jgi:N-acetylneuraminic acid mutarotase
MEHTATLLRDGRVLVAGGKNTRSGGPSSPSALGSAEIYDPVRRTWTMTGEMADIRFAHTATLLNDGKVLVVGGSTKEVERPPIASAELYDPRSGTWASAGALPDARANHTASLLGDGRVLVAGGLSAGTAPDGKLATTTSVELYDPGTNSWSAGPPTGVARTLHTATTLQNGKVLIVGGFGTGYGDFLKAAELFDPVTNSWTVAGLAIGGRAVHTASLLPNGSVLVVGGGPAYEDPGSRVDSIATSEVYDPGTNRWAPARILNTARAAHTAVVLDGPACRNASAPKYCGAVLVSGGTTTTADPDPKISPIPQFTSELYR